MRWGVAVLALLLAGCTGSPPDFVAMQGEDDWVRLDCDESAGPSEPMKVSAVFGGSPEAQAKRFANALGLELRGKNDGDRQVLWDTDNGTISIGTGYSRGWTWTPADKTLPNKTIDEATAYLEALAHRVGLPEPTGNESFPSQTAGFSLGLTIDTPADFDIIVAWNANREEPLFRQDHTVIVAPVWDWVVGFTMDVEEAKEIAVAFAQCHPGRYEVTGEIAAGEEVQRVVSSGRPAYYIPVYAGTGFEGMCNPDGSCSHRCPPPTRWITVDGRSGAIWGAGNWSLCY